MVGMGPMGPPFHTIPDDSRPSPGVRPGALHRCAPSPPFAGPLLSFSASPAPSAKRLRKGQENVGPHLQGCVARCLCSQSHLEQILHGVARRCPPPPHNSAAPKEWRLAAPNALYILTKVTCHKQAQALRCWWRCSQGDGILPASCSRWLSPKAFRCGKALDCKLFCECSTRGANISNTF